MFVSGWKQCIDNNKTKCILHKQCWALNKYNILIRNDNPLFYSEVDDKNNLFIVYQTFIILAAIRLKLNHTAFAHEKYLLQKDLS